MAPHTCQLVQHSLLFHVTAIKDCQECRSTHLLTVRFFSARNSVWYPRDRWEDKRLYLSMGVHQGRELHPFSHTWPERRDCQTFPGGLSLYLIRRPWARHPLPQRLLPRHRVLVGLW